MNLDLNDIVAFVKVAQTGSFTRAAESLGVPKSTVSTKITRLEQDLGVNLIHRTTRKINLTQIGRTFFERCVSNIQDLKSAEEEITFSKNSPSGKIKVSAPVFLGTYFLPQILADFRKEFPGVQIELILTDRAVDLVGEGVDVAIRAGQLPDSTLISKKIGATYFSLYASPAYMKKAGRLSHPKNLKEHRCIQFAPLGKDKWTLNNPGAKISVTIPMKGDCVVDDLAATKSLVLYDQGIALLPAFSCAQETKSKDIVAVLPDWRTEVRPIHFVYPSGKFMQPKLKQFISHAERVMRARF